MLFILILREINLFSTFGMLNEKYFIILLERIFSLKETNKDNIMNKEYSIEGNIVNIEVRISKWHTNRKKIRLRYRKTA